MVPSTLNSLGCYLVASVSTPRGAHWLEVWKTDGWQYTMRGSDGYLTNQFPASSPVEAIGHMAMSAALWHGTRAFKVTLHHLSCPFTSVEILKTEAAIAAHNAAPARAYLVCPTPCR
jgi:hypothetical protein